MKIDVVVIGAGPAGLAAAVSAHDAGARVLVVEREEQAGGILKQCIHDGFGIVRYKQKLSGPEYAWRDLEQVRARGIEVMTSTFLLALNRQNDEYVLTLQNAARAVFSLRSRALVAAFGCRERTSRQIFIHGSRPAGIFTAGTVQNMVNLQGWLPGRRCLILGSGDIGLIMARRLTLEGAEVVGVYELKSEPSGLTRNVVQCLDDFNIPLHLSTTVTHVHGRQRLEGVTVANVDKELRVICGTEVYIPCDTLVLSVGLIPENDCLEPLKVVMDAATGGPRVDQDMMTNVAGLYSCGNALHVNDLVDYVSQSGETAGRAAAAFALGRWQQEPQVPVLARGLLLYALPQQLRVSAGQAVIWFRSSCTRENVRITVQSQGKVLRTKKYSLVRPPEMERVELTWSEELSGPVEIVLEEV